MFVFLFSVSQLFAQTKPNELTYSIMFPATHKIAVSANEWAREIEKRTNGKVKIVLYPGGTLTPPNKCYEGIVNRISDIGMSLFGYTRGKFPLTEVSDLPLGYKSGLIATRAINAYYTKFQPKELQEVKIMYLHAHGPVIFHTKKPVTNLEDLKGMKIRSGGLTAKVVTALGAVPVAMPITDAYDALSRGIAEGILVPFEAMDGWKLGEVVKYTTENYASGASGGFFVAMNKNKWNSLSPDIQRVIEKINQEWIERTGMLWVELDKAGRDFVLKHGNKIIPLTKSEDQRWSKAMDSILDDYVKNTTSKGLPGKEVLKFYQDYLSDQK